MTTYEGTALEYYPAFDGVSTIAQTCLVAQSFGTGEDNAYAGYFYSAGTDAIFSNVSGAYGAAVYATNEADGNTIVAYGFGESYAVVYGENLSEGGIGLYGRCEEPGGAGIYGKADNGWGVYGVSNVSGVLGRGHRGVGGYALGDYGVGVWGKDNGHSHGQGVFVQSTVSSTLGVDHPCLSAYASGDLAWGAKFVATGSAAGAAKFHGAIYLGLSVTEDSPLYVSGVTEISGELECDELSVYGALYKYGGGFRIDHPLNPQNQYLDHSFLESPEMKNLYEGLASANADGEIEVVMPAYFEALNKDFRYQLCAVGGPAPNLYVKKELTGGRFTIAGASPGQRVSWMVTGVRQDSWADANRIAPEHAKPAPLRGTKWKPREKLRSPSGRPERSRPDRTPPTTAREEKSPVRDSPPKRK